MRQIAENLRAQVYVSRENVDAIRRYIRAKNPGCSEAELSAVFADALHRIIDSRIYQFEEQHRKRIKTDLLNLAVRKSEFSIDGSEVFSCCLGLKLHDIRYLQSLTGWLNQNQPVTVTMQQVDKLVTRVEKLEAEFIGNNLEEIIDEIGYNDSETGTIDSRMESILQEEAVPDAAQIRASRFCMLERWTLLKPMVPAAIVMVLIAAIVLQGIAGQGRVLSQKYRDQGRYADIGSDQVDRYLSIESRILGKLDGMTGEKQLVLLDGLHGELRYEAIDEGRLRKWLEGKDSMLAEEPYFSAIIDTSRIYGIHPALMFAIVGQEQGFVPKTSAAAERIANNPFNVYGSWEKYNTDIYDSSRLAAGTIIEASRNRPAYMNGIKWINRRYAEDPNWWNG
ncbi:MAG TPA: hypothetical protein VN549_09220, partial [Negativicutes bacterium]|nr:hypothetical protein [Negativicutes bacterium]